MTEILGPSKPILSQESKWNLLGMSSAGAIGYTQHFIRNGINRNGGLDPDTIFGHLVYNGGDFGDGYILSALVGFGFKRLGLKSPYLRANLSAGTGAISVIITETSSMASDLFGVPDTADIPAGLIGVACYLGVNLWINRKKV